MLKSFNIKDVDKNEIEETCYFYKVISDNEFEVSRKKQRGFYPYVHYNNKVDGDYTKNIGYIRDEHNSILYICFYNDKIEPKGEEE